MGVLRQRYALLWVEGNTSPFAAEPSSLEPSHASTRLDPHPTLERSCDLGRAKPPCSHSGTNSPALHPHTEHSSSKERTAGSRNVQFTLFLTLAPQCQQAGCRDKSHQGHGIRMWLWTFYMLRSPGILQCPISACLPHTVCSTWDDRVSLAWIWKTCLILNQVLVLILHCRIFLELITHFQKKKKNTSSGCARKAHLTHDLFESIPKQLPRNLLSIYSPLRVCGNMHSAHLGVSVRDMATRLLREFYTPRHQVNWLQLCVRSKWVSWNGHIYAPSHTFLELVE